MTLIVKVGNVFYSSPFNNDTYFEADETYTIEVVDRDDAEEQLTKQYDGIYTIITKHDETLVACVY